MSRLIPCLCLSLAVIACGDDDSTVSDAGNTPDSGSPIDSGQPSDSGGASDAQTQADGGAPGSDAGMCMPATSDTSAFDRDCTTTGDECPDGYTCQPFVGIILQMQCQILCEADCECPADHRCVMIMDQASQWRQCEPS